MNLFRIVLKRTNKRKHSDSPFRDAFMVLLFVFLLPYVFAYLWGHIGEESTLLFGYQDAKEEWTDTAYEVRLQGKWGSKQMTMQNYLIQKLKLVMPYDEESGTRYELEALKAQAVLLRTGVWEMYLADGNVALQDDTLFYYVENRYNQEEEALYAAAVYETDGIYLSYNDKPVKAAYFPVSNGRTRNAAEVVQNESYPYLVSVECRQDILAKNFQSRTSFSKEEYCRLIRRIFPIDDENENIWNRLELTYDSTEYVKEAEVNGHSCNGEIFRDVFGLSSSCFYAEWNDDSVTFFVKGVGHGLGMSQYGANQIAISGETFDKILENYFFQAELVKIE